MDCGCSNNVEAKPSNLRKKEKTKLNLHISFDKSDANILRTFEWSGLNLRSAETLAKFGKDYLWCSINILENSYQVEFNGIAAKQSASGSPPISSFIDGKRVMKAVSNSTLEKFVLETVAKTPHPMIVTPLLQFTNTYAPDLYKLINGILYDQVRSESENPDINHALFDMGGDSNCYDENGWCPPEFRNCKTCNKELKIKELPNPPGGGGGSGWTCWSRYASDMHQCHTSNLRCNAMCKRGFHTAHITGEYDLDFDDIEPEIPELPPGGTDWGSIVCFSACGLSYSMCLQQAEDDYLGCVRW